MINRNFQLCISCIALEAQYEVRHSKRTLNKDHENLRIEEGITSDYQ